MSDLISRKALLAKAVEANPMGGMIGGKFIEDLIKSEDCAYDVDGVVEKIKMLRHPYTTFSEGFGDLNAYDFYINKAINIVKGAVKDE